MEGEEDHADKPICWKKEIRAWLIIWIWNIVWITEDKSTSHLIGGGFSNFTWSSYVEEDDESLGSADVAVNCEIALTLIVKDQEACHMNTL